MPNYSISLDVDDHGYHFMVLTGNGVSEQTFGTREAALTEIIETMNVEEAK